MELLKTDSPEYRAFAASAIVNNERHILKQLRAAGLSGKPNIRLLQDFEDDLMYSSFVDEQIDKQEHVIITGEEYYNALCRLQAERETKARNSKKFR